MTFHREKREKETRCEPFFTAAISPLWSWLGKERFVTYRSLSCIDSLVNTLRTFLCITRFRYSTNPILFLKLIFYFYNASLHSEYLMVLLFNANGPSPKFLCAQLTYTLGNNGTFCMFEASFSTKNSPFIALVWLLKFWWFCMRCHIYYSTSQSENTTKSCSVSYVKQTRS